MDGATFMSKARRVQLPGKPLVKKYVDASGKKRYAGIPQALKASQTLVVASEPVLFEMVIYTYVARMYIYIYTNTTMCVCWVSSGPTRSSLENELRQLQSNMPMTGFKPMEIKATIRKKKIHDG